MSETLANQFATVLAGNGGTVATGAVAFSVRDALPSGVAPPFRAALLPAGSPPGTLAETVLVGAVTGTAWSSITRAVETAYGSPAAVTLHDGDAVVIVLSKVGLDNIVGAAVAVETARAEGAEGANATAIAAETTRAEAAEALLAPKASDLIAGDPTARSLAVPTFAKYAGNPIFSAANLVNLTSMCWPWLVRVDSIFGGLGHYGERYRIYYSTDHEGGTAGVGLMTALALLGPWTDQGLVFRDTTGGNQTENPSVIYDSDRQVFNLYYHQVNAVGSVASEVTKLATMSLATAMAGADAWTITTAVPNGIVLDIPVDGTGWPGNGGWGYFRPFRIGQAWYGHLRIGGGIDQAFGLAKSNDGIHWRQDPRLLFFGADKIHDSATPSRFDPSSHYIGWACGNVVLWRGQYLWIGPLESYPSTGGSPGFSYYVVAPISRDFRKLLAPPTVLFSSSQSWESPLAGQPPGMGNARSGGSVIVGPDGKIYLFYCDGYDAANPANGGNLANGFGIAVSQ